MGFGFWGLDFFAFFLDFLRLDVASDGRALAPDAGAAGTGVRRTSASPRVAQRPLAAGPRAGSGDGAGWEVGVGAPGGAGARVEFGRTRHRNAPLRTAPRRFGSNCLLRSGRLCVSFSSCNVAGWLEGGGLRCHGNVNSCDCSGCQRAKICAFFLECGVYAERAGTHT